jgi:hypothetical protein
LEKSQSKVDFRLQTSGIRLLSFKEAVFVTLEQVILEEILPRVRRPARYLGTEWNAVRKNWDHAAVKMVFAFPDLYEVGMSHLGLQILYGLVNNQ